MKNFIKFFEIPAIDVKRAVKFYEAVFGIEIQVHEFGHETMAMFPDNIGSISKAEDFKPCENGVLITFNGGTDLQNRLQLAKSNGGIVVIDKTKIEADNQGYFAVVKDTEGNRIGLYSDN